MWSLKLPPKVKHFLWRVLSGSLPTKDNLQTRRVAVNSWCPVCHNEYETPMHSLMTCQFADLCWRYAGLMTNYDQCSDFMQWLSLAFETYTRKEVQTIGMICWSIWRNRNEIVWNQKGEEFDRVVESAKLIFNQWHNAQDKSFDNYLEFMTQADGIERWEQPKEGTVKINVDAALFTDSNRYSYSMLARNHRGEMLEARSSCKQGCVQPEIAEAIGIREALSWIKDKEWPAVALEIDCLTVVQVLRCSSVRLSYLGRVVDDCLALLSQLKERNITLSFVKRSANKVAHFIARHSSSIADRIWRSEDVHSDFLHVLAADLKF